MTEDEVKAILLDVVAGAGLTPGPVLVSTDDEGGRNIEMRSSRWRILVSIELDPNQSGWSLVSRDTIGGIGDLSSLQVGLAAALQDI